MLFALVDSLQRMLKKSLNPGLTGSELVEALLEYIRAHDSVVLEGCDKVASSTIDYRYLWQPVD